MTRPQPLQMKDHQTSLQSFWEIIVATRHEEVITIMAFTRKSGQFI
ncbi:hypothetical protein AM1_F0102 (plasmid) [Acaryochloris marina MBIC11017]|uniref:Uncharacterized protein n=1 Tax=Acaryochloris marina (strain MBIC 11017) TaxID=329726 RepID=A8ZQ83_ACAM1|nr:hypothetical protein AM1_F0102 [Acaryochloris marina MBIC11017]